MQQNNCCQTLQNLHSEKECPGELTDTIILLGSCACPDVAKIMQDQLIAMQWEVLKHAAYSLDLSPCNLLVFGPLKKTLKGHTFISYGDVQEAILQW
jgi:hypothetical protein